MSSNGQPRAETFTLKNGLKVIVRPRPGSPVVSVQVWYRVGSFHEHVGIRGIAHLFEHMMFRGSENFGPEEHSRLVQKIGGYDNAFTSEDMTVYHEMVPAHHIELPFRLESDRMGFLKLDEDVLRTEREVVKEEFRQTLNNPFHRAYLEFRRRLFPGHPYAWTPLGDMEDIEHISVRDCLDFYRRYYTPANAVLVVAGEVDVPGVRELAERHFGTARASESPSIPPLPSSPPDSVPPDSSIERRIVLNLDIELPIVALAYHIPGAAHEDIPVLEVLTAILSDGESSRLYRNLVRSDKIAVHALGSVLLQKDPGLYAVAAAHLPNRRSSKVEDRIRREVAQVVSGGVTPEELDKAVRQAVADEVFRSCSADHLANGLGEAEVLEGDFRRFETAVERYRAIRPEDVRRVAETYLSPEREIVLVARPNKTRWFHYLIPG